METELKYLIPENLNCNDIFKDDYILEYTVPNTYEKIQMKALYFDTKDYDLKNKGLSFRIRYEGKNLIFTTKYGGNVENGLHKREEINIEVDEDFLNNPSVEVLKAYDIYDTFKDVVGDKPLLKIIEMNYVRKLVEIKYLDANFILSADEGEIVTEKGNERIYELEAELFRGNEKNLVKFSQNIAKKFLLSPCNISKLHRGMNIIQGNLL